MPLRRSGGAFFFAGSACVLLEFVRASRYLKESTYPFGYFPKGFP
jgi:hypothetical protein